MCCGIAMRAIIFWERCGKVTLKLSEWKPEPNSFVIPGKNLELPGLGLHGAFQGIFASPRTLPAIPSSHGPWFVPLLLSHMHFIFPFHSFIFPFYLFLSLFFFYFLLSSLCPLYPLLFYNVVLMTFLITGQNTV